MKYLYLLFTAFFSFVLLGICSTKENLTNIVGDQSDLYTVSIYLNKNVTQAEIEKTKEDILSTLSDNIKKINLISTETQINDVLSSLPPYAAGLVDFEDLKGLVGPLFEVQLKTFTSDSKIEKIKLFSSVQQVFFGSDWIHSFEKIFDFYQSLLSILFIIFLSFAISFMFLLIKNHLLAQTETISILSLHGSTPGQILKKYFLFLIFYTVVSYFAGIGLYFLAYKSVSYSLSSSEVLSFVGSKIQFVSKTNMAFVALSLALTLSLSYLFSLKFIVRKYFKYE